PILPPKIINAAPTLLENPSAPSSSSSTVLSLTPINEQIFNEEDIYIVTFLDHHCLSFHDLWLPTPVDARCQLFEYLDYCLEL
ncbi:hypothetical protein DOY81_005165, partial [Sarcophaga bullata]